MGILPKYREAIVEEPVVKISRATVLQENELDEICSRAFGFVDSVFTQADNAHGSRHARQVFERIKSNISTLEPTLTSAEKLALMLAALLHDTGYASRREEWSPDNREHICASLALALEYFQQEDILATEPTLREVILILIAHHDDSNYRFPSAAYGGEVRPVELGEYTTLIEEIKRKLNSPHRLNFLVDVLQEADSWAATGLSGARRTFEYSIARGVPELSSGNPLSAWCWEESAVSNVRVAAKRALIQAITSDQLVAAEAQYSVADQFLGSLLADQGLRYYPEIKPWNDEELLEWTEQTVPNVAIRRYLPWPNLEQTLRDVPLLGDPNLRPYAEAQLTPRYRAISSLRPSAYYMLGHQIEKQRSLGRGLYGNYRLSLFDLVGMLNYEWEGASHCMAPPIVENYFEPSEGRVISIIVDGLHRIALARALGVEAMWVVEISRVPEQYPIVSLPLAWEDVKVVETVPSTEAKRRFRFSSFDEANQVLGSLTKTPLSSENYKYFLYRDLSALGSGGVRPSAT